MALPHLDFEQLTADERILICIAEPRAQWQLGARTVRASGQEGR